ncbi:MAG: hypothetical protein KF861_10500, partial [Planctomycetaceae bacterium]|nr:hypothetical protein [Planctomycetaceae bacterium]
MLRWRILVSAVLIPSAVGLFLWDARLGPPAPILFVLCVILGLRCAWELVSLLQRDVPELQRDVPDVRFAPVAVGVLLLLVATWMPHWATTGDAVIVGVLSRDRVFAVCLLLLMFIHAVRFRMPGGRLRSLGAEWFALTY